MFQEDAEQREYERQLFAYELDKRKYGFDGPMDLKRDDWLPEDEHGNALDLAADDPRRFAFGAGRA